MWQGCSFQAGFLGPLRAFSQFGLQALEVAESIRLPDTQGNEAGEEGLARGYMRLSSTVGTRPRSPAPQPRCLSLSHQLDCSECLAFISVSFSLDSASVLFFLGPPGLLAGARLSSGRTVCAVEKALGWPGLEAKAHSSPCLLEDLRQTCTSPLAQFPLWSNQGLGQGLQAPSSHLIL